MAVEMYVVDLCRLFDMAMDQSEAIANYLLSIESIDKFLSIFEARPSTTGGGREGKRIARHVREKAAAEAEEVRLGAVEGVILCQTDVRAPPSLQCRKTV